MIRALIAMEVKKLCTQKTLVTAFLFCLLLNVGLLGFQTATQTVPISAYAKVQATLAELPNEERYAWATSYEEQMQAFLVLTQLQAFRLQPEEHADRINALLASHPDIEEQYGEAFQSPPAYFSGSLDLEAELMVEVRSQLDTLQQYNDFLGRIQARADGISNISVFANGDPYSIANIEKTAKDYQIMQGQTPIFQLEIGILQALSFPMTNFFLILLGLMIVSTMILSEREQGTLALLQMYHHGDWKLLLAKISVMMMAFCMVTISFNLCNLLYMSFVCGILDLQAPLISLASFQMTTLPISIQTFLLLFIGTKWLALCLIGAIMMLVCLIARNKGMCFLILGGLFVIELVAYLWIPYQSYWAIAKHINLLALLDTTTLYQTYLNVNVLGTPISLQNSLIVLMILLYPTVSIITCYIFQRRIPMAWQASSPSKQSRRTPSCSLWKQEACKLLVIEKGWLILLGFLLLQGVTFQKLHYAPSQEEQTWMMVSEPLTQTPEEAHAYMEQMSEHYQSLHDQLSQLEARYQAEEITIAQRNQSRSKLELQLYAEPAFQEIQARYAYVEEEPSRRFLIPFSYEQLFLKEQTLGLPMLLVLIGLLLLCSDLQCLEYQHQVHSLLITTPKGRSGIRKRKLALCACATLFFYLLALLPPIIKLTQTYGFSSLTASITSFPAYAQLLPGITILQFICLLALCHMSACFFVIAATLALSTWCRQQRIILCMTLLLFVAPLLLSLFGISIFDAISLHPLICASTYFMDQDNMVVFLSYLSYGGLGIFALWHYLKRT